MQPVTRAHAQATRKLTPTFTQIYSYAIPECQVVLYQHTTALLSVFAVLQPWAGSEGRVVASATNEQPTLQRKAATLK